MESFFLTVPTRLSSLTIAKVLSDNLGLPDMDAREADEPGDLNSG